MTVSYGPTSAEATTTTSMPTIAAEADTPLDRVRRKLEEHGPRTITTVRGVGYRYDANDPAVV